MFSSGFSCLPYESEMSAVFALGLTFITCVSGLSLRQCQSNFIDVDMDSSNNEVTCEGAKGTERVEWQYTDGGVNTGSISCSPSGPCTSNVLFTATRTAGSTSSRLTFKQDVKRFRALYGSFTLTCLTSDPSNPGVVTDQVSCRIDVVHPAEASCSVQTSRWTVGGSCSISKVYSSVSRYSCQFFNGSQSSQTTPVTQPTPYTPQPHQDPDYRTGSCDFSNVTLSTSEGDYYYKAVIVPGNVHKVFGPVTVDAEYEITPR